MHQRLTGLPFCRQMFASFCVLALFSPPTTSIKSTVRANSRAALCRYCTCPFVNKVQKIAHEHSQNGYLVLILGNRNHPEVQGILGWAGNKGIAFQEITELKEAALKGCKVCLVAQTTENPERLRRGCGSTQFFRQSPQRNLWHRCLNSPDVLPPADCESGDQAWQLVHARFWSK